MILETRKKHPLAGAVAMDKIMDAEGIHIPHNWIHRFLKEKRLAQDEHTQGKTAVIKHDGNTDNQ